ncbi:hypothetical protein BGW36DRAFT_360346 [Talaromyces proteolyticus]|uniref:Uncharacterized protein n=1 Tax=Talaromyces proteolyticus TaxID=1131652 RepID=A0AAD4KPL3_9EURO|nr:uncharacterized protein BGW36DRAFT_360346 [Talaromyces proteolyticus]KAH8696519.1 hypothetical protein BGW36DRAFT_360346 [Talaromyces proteolyticus]
MNNRNSTMFSSWVTGTPSQTYSNFTTSWYTPTLNVTALVTSTVTYNSTVASIVSERQKYCWLTGSQWDVPEDDYPDGCQSLLDEYCFVSSVDGPIPTSSAHIPAVCTLTETDYMPAAIISSSVFTVTPTTLSTLRT